MKTDKILLDHGSGGKASQRLISDLILKYFNNSILGKLDDAAEFSLPENAVKISFSTDSYTVDPLFFPGGNIGDLAINGTVNDISMKGAYPLFLSVGFIIEEGLSLEIFEKILSSMKKAADEAGVKIVTGDTKVVGKNAADKIFINTSGIGIIHPEANISGHNAKPGDKIILSGTIADHGITVLSEREGLSFSSATQSDSAPLNHMVKELLALGQKIHVLRDPTRGGLGTTLNEIAAQSGVGLTIIEDKIPINEGVSGSCELLGLDPLYLANEGKLIAVVDPEVESEALELIRSDKYGKKASVIGEVASKDTGKVFMNTVTGSRRIIDMLSGEQLPRIC